MASTVSDQKTIKERTDRDRSGTIWIIQAITGLLLILLLGLHMIAHHYVVEGGLRNFQQVQDYISNPIIFVLEVLFLLVVTPHAVLGLQSIVMDLGPSKSARRTITWVFRIIMVVTIVYGIWLAIALQNV